MAFLITFANAIPRFIYLLSCYPALLILFFVVSYSFAIELSGGLFVFNFTFNANENKWYFDVLKNSVHVVSGVKLVTGEDILSQFRAYDIPEGVVSIVDVTGLYADPDDLNFGESVFLRYET